MAVEPSTMNKIVVNFTTCEPAPSSGYRVQWRVAGSEDAYIDAGYFFTTPAVFYDAVNPPGTCYEGFITSACGDIIGTPVSWVSCDSGDSGESGESGEPETVFITNVSSAYISITNISSLAGFALDSPVASGQTRTGIHTAFTAAISVVVEIDGTLSGSLRLSRNGVLLQCMNIGFPGGYVFSSFTFDADDVIQILWISMSCS